MSGSNGTRFILDFNGGRILECATSESGVEIRNYWMLPDGTSDRILLHRDMSGQEFSATCTEAGVPKISSIAAVMPARLEIVRSIALPASTPGEIEAMVRYEAGEKLPYPHDNWQWTFDKIPGREKDRVEIVLYAVRKDAVRNCIELFHDSGIKLEKIYPWSACAAPFIRDGKTGTAALIVPDEKDISLTITCGEKIRYTRVLPGRDAARLPVELDLAMDEISNEEDVRVVLLGNSIESDILEEIRRELNDDLLVLDWDIINTSGTKNATGTELPMAAAVGASAARMAESGNGADLIPRASREEVAASRKKAAAVASGIFLAFMVAVAVVFAISTNNRYENDISTLNTEIEIMTPRIEIMNAVRAQLSAHEISTSGRSALNILREISKAVPEGEIRITRLLYEKGEKAALSGQASSHEKVMELIAGMEDSGMFRETHLDFSREVEEFSQPVVNFEVSSVPTVEDHK